MRSVHRIYIFQQMSPKDDEPEANNRSGFEHNYLAITLTAQNTDTRISLTTDESYNLTISSYYGVFLQI